MKKLYICLLLLVTISTLTSCLEQISSDFDFEEQVFVSGLMTNESGFVTVQIQKTVTVTDTSYHAINDAHVSLYTKDTSNTVSLVSDSFTIDNGEYSTTDSITPIVGNRYWIEVILQDQRVLTSEEEILKAPIPIIDIVKTDDRVKITFTGPVEEQNFYLFEIKIFKDGALFNDDSGVGLDSFSNEIAEKDLYFENINTGDQLKVNIYNINFSTFEFYRKIYGARDNNQTDLSLYLPINIAGNIINKSAIGNFGVAGFSTVTIDF